MGEAELARVEDAGGVEGPLQVDEHAVVHDQALDDIAFVTGLEVKPVVDLFIGFGGVHERARVRDNAEVYVTEPTLKAVLPYLIES